MASGFFSTAQSNSSGMDCCAGKSVSVLFHSRRTCRRSDASNKSSVAVTEGSSRGGEASAGEFWNPAAKTAKGRLSGRVGRQSKHVDEKTNHVLRFPPVSPGEGTAYDNVGLVGIAMKQDLESGQQK